MGHRQLKGQLFLQELKTGVVPLLIPTPNANNEVGYNRDRFVYYLHLLHSTANTGFCTNVD